MEIHSIYGDYLSSADGLSWGWEHTAVYYMGTMHQRGTVKFAEAAKLAAHDYSEQPSVLCSLSDCL